MKPGATLALLLLASVSTGQIAYPDLVVQDVDWSSGVHAYAVTQGILAPAVPELPVNVEETAEVEFVSARHVHLTPGFHAGDFVYEGFFHARIDEAAGPAGDIVVVAPDPVEYLIDHVLHVPKWEKLEVGLQLPQEYKDAIDRFFANYYSNGTAQAATPAAVNDTYDLNPYADDSLQLVMQLTDPDGQQRMKWGFFMREAKWDETAPDPDEAILVEHSSSPYHPYHVRFRFAPDKEGPWQFTLSLKAPYTTTLANEPLPHLVYTGNTFVCDPPLEDNKGYLQVNEANRRILQFENGDPFFGLGTNMADARNKYWTDGPSDRGISMHQRDFNSMQETMALLHDVGGNYLRMYLMRNIFAPEWVNLGVYDNFKAPVLCPIMPEYANNSQFNCWAFDRMLDQARANNIYIQLCIDPYPPIVAYQSYIWGAHPYVLNYLENDRDPDGRYDLKKFFYAEGDPDNTDEGVFYYWKRKYKYMMARWGYSVNVAAMEPFNEIDQMLTYRDPDPAGVDVNTTCPSNQLNWPRDPDLPGVLNSWISDIADHVRGPVDLDDPVNSPLGEDKKLFLMSFTDAVAPDAPNSQQHYLPLSNEKVDLMDIHRYAWPNGSLVNTPDEAMYEGFEHARAIRQQLPSADPAVDRKPFNHGEFNYFTHLPFGGQSHDVENYFLNYDVSFHNEIWSSAFSGKFAAGTTWLWERVYWWKDALRVPPSESNDPVYWFNNPTGFSNTHGFENVLNIGGAPVTVPNRRLHHHFRSLADILAHPGLDMYSFFRNEYSAHKVLDETNANELEAYYLKNTDNTVAVGWLHNRNAWVMNSYYLASGSLNENFLGCDPPSGQSITLAGFEPDTEYFITWFPTRMNSAVYPADMEVSTDGTGGLPLDLTGQFGGTTNNYLDTLRADYAFIITPEPLVKSLMVPYEDNTSLNEGTWDFSLFPNPTRDLLSMRFPDEHTKDIVVVDVSGRVVARYANVTASLFQMPTHLFAKGAYGVRVIEGDRTKAKKFMIH